LIYLLLGFLALEIVWALGSGPAEWSAIATRFESPWYLGFHMLALISVVFVGIRFFGFFPKAQPPRIGSVKPPPQPVILGGLYVAWIGVTAIFSLILSGALFR
jgi:fumarate reductase subunit C